MKRFILLIGFFCLLGVYPLVQAYAAEKVPEPITLKFGHWVSEASWNGQRTQWWVNEAEKRTNGRLKIKMFWSESLVKFKDALPAIQSKFVDLTSVSSTYHPSNLPLFMMLDNPGNCGEDYIASNLAVEETMTKEPNLMKELERENIIQIIPHSSGSGQLGTKRPVSGLADLKGKTFRTYGGGKAKWCSLLGLNPVFMSYSDIYEAIDRGTIFGADIGILLSDGFKHYDVMKGILMVNFGAAQAIGTFMRLDEFRKLPKDIQKTLLDLRKDYIMYFCQKLMDDEAQCLARVEKNNGVKVVKLSPEDQKISLAAIKKAQEFLIGEQVKGGHKAAPAVWEYYKNALDRIEKGRAKK